LKKPNLKTMSKGNSNNFDKDSVGVVGVAKSSRLPKTFLKGLDREKSPDVLAFKKQTTQDHVRKKRFHRK
jgi:hypothetical protein